MKLGWSRGSDLFESIIDSLSEYVDDDDTRVSIYKDLIEVFENFDCDTLNELISSTKDKAFIDAFSELHPDEDCYQMNSYDQEDDDW